MATDPAPTPKPRANPRLSKTIGEGAQKSGPQAKAAAERANQQTATVVTDTDVPRGVNGSPMLKIVMTASELIPTGQFANVSIGPAQITAYVDLDRVLDKGEAYFSDEQRSMLAQALNELAEIVEGDVVAVQRNLVMESIQEQVSSNGGK